MECSMHLCVINTCCTSWRAASWLLQAGTLWVCSHSCILWTPPTSSTNWQAAVAEGKEGKMDEISVGQFLKQWCDTLWQKGIKLNRGLRGYVVGVQDQNPLLFGLGNQYPGFSRNTSRYCNIIVLFQRPSSPIFIAYSLHWCTTFSTWAKCKFVSFFYKQIQNVHKNRWLEINWS